SFPKRRPCRDDGLGQAAMFAGGAWTEARPPRVSKIGPALSSSNTIRRRPSADPVQKHAPGNGYGAKKGLTSRGPLQKRYLTNSTSARSCGPARPRAIGWDGEGVSVIFSQTRHVKVSRTWVMTFQCAGTRSSVSVVCSPSLRMRSLPQWRHVHGAPCTTRSRGRIERHAGGLHCFALSRDLWPVCFLQGAPVDPFQHIGELSR